MSSTNQLNSKISTIIISKIMGFTEFHAILSARKHMYGGATHEPLGKCILTRYYPNASRRIGGRAAVQYLHFQLL